MDGEHPIAQLYQEATAEVLSGDDLLAKRVLAASEVVTRRLAQEYLGELRASGDEYGRAADEAGYAEDVRDLAAELPDSMRGAGLVVNPLTVAGVMLGAMMAADLDEEDERRVLVACASEGLRRLLEPTGQASADAPM